MRYTDHLTPLAVLFLAGCAGAATPPPPSPPPARSGVSDVPAKIGEPYAVDGVTYAPRDVASYDEVGYAGWYGEEMVGRTTARGEPFDPDAITAAHRTLPLPTYVEVTALATGRTILVRVNDRGPFRGDRLIDLSAGAARQLGITQAGVAGVRVRKTSPVEQERAVLRNGGSVAARIDTPPSLLRVLRDKLAALPKPTQAAATAMLLQPSLAQDSKASSAPAAAVRPPAAKAAPLRRVDPPPGSRSDSRFVIERHGAGTEAAAATVASAPAPPPAAAAAVAAGWRVQLASFGSRGRAESLAKSVGGTVVASGRGYRVHMGPYSSEKAARAELESMKRRGYPGALLVRP